MKYPGSVTSIYKNYVLAPGEEKTFIDQIPGKHAFSSGEESFRFRRVRKKSMHYYVIDYQTLSINGRCAGGGGPIKTDVPHLEALQYLKEDSDKLVLDALEKLGLSDLVDAITQGEPILTRKTDSYRRNSNADGIERKIDTRIPNRADFTSGKDRYTFISCYPRHAYIFGIRPHNITVIGRSAGGGHETLRNGPWHESLDLLSNEIDTAGLFELRGLGLRRLVELVRKRKHTMKKNDL